MNVQRGVWRKIRELKFFINSGNQREASFSMTPFTYCRILISVIHSSLCSYILITSLFSCDTNWLHVINTERRRGHQKISYPLASWIKGESVFSVPLKPNLPSWLFLESKESKTWLEMDFITTKEPQTVKKERTKWKLKIICKWVPVSIYILNEQNGKAIAQGLRM